MTTTIITVAALLLIAYALSMGRAGRTQDWDALSRQGETDTDGC